MNKAAAEKRLILPQQISDVSSATLPWADYGRVDRFRQIPVDYRLRKPFHSANRLTLVYDFADFKEALTRCAAYGLFCSP